MSDIAIPVLGALVVAGLVLVLAVDPRALGRWGRPAIVLLLVAASAALGGRLAVLVLRARRADAEGRAMDAGLERSDALLAAQAAEALSEQAEHLARADAARARADAAMAEATALSREIADVLERTNGRTGR